MSESLGTASSIGRPVPPSARLRCAAVVELEIQRLVQPTPSCVAHIPETLSTLSRWTASFQRMQIITRDVPTSLLVQGSSFERPGPASYSRQHPLHPQHGSIGLLELEHGGLTSDSEPSSAAAPSNGDNQKSSG
ncbi:hypothetical protein DAPPUDRAFT_117409 [Daphnia pulex]|uniref:Uncharacterized protein n=1 Tax=Daphnia pulex TaxID=6669 RepID=E9HSJ6_DAPPU|nr:hypothetical protein DAPPUDRAFT_117409 [Daphnia pulex]|eukprot:EFX65287.1 hypothetical protein DAPPUDRAFT_117409 [Daphnia pulex]